MTILCMHFNQNKIYCIRQICCCVKLTITLLTHIFDIFFIYILLVYAEKLSKYQPHYCTVVSTVSHLKLCGNTLFVCLFFLPQLNQYMGGWTRKGTFKYIKYMMNLQQYKFNIFFDSNWCSKKLRNHQAI